MASLLFLTTCGSVFFVYLVRWQEGPVVDGAGGAGWRALLFTATLMVILVAHELGHYVTARAHGIRLALPWFLPAPVLVGTLGAVIRWSDAPRSRTALLEMGAMGPLTGLVAVAGVVAVSLWTGPIGATDTGVGLATPLLWWVLSGLLTGAPPPAISTQDPLAFAAWIGALVTAMNLVPVGQLDGGHVAAALRPDRASAIGWTATAALLLAGLAWPGWAVWAALVHLLGTARDPIRDARPPSQRANRVAFATVIAFGLCVTPIPTFTP